MLTKQIEDPYVKITEEKENLIRSNASLSVCVVGVLTRLFLCLYSCGSENQA